MIIYLFLIIVVLLSLFFNIDKIDKLKKIWIIIIFFILTVISAIRSVNVGVDTIQYYDAFKKISLLSFNQSMNTRYEIGFFYLVKLISCITSNPQIFLAIISFFIIPCIGRFIYKNSQNVVFSTLLYVLFNIYFFNLTGMRQSLALVFLLKAYEYIKSDNTKKFIIYTVIASLFHSSAIIFLILLALKKIKYKKKYYFLTIFISIVAFIFLKPIFIAIANIIGKYSGYIDSKDFGVSNYFGSLFQFLLTFAVYSFCIFMYFANSKKQKNNSHNYFDIGLWLLSLNVICQFMAMKMNIIGRMNQYFWIYSIILIPNLILLEKKSKKRMLLCVTIIFLALLYWFIVGIYRPEWNGAIPYSTFFS